MKASFTRSRRRTSKVALDVESGILSATLDESVEWRRGFHFEGVLVFDLDLDSRLCNVDLLIPESMWTSAPFPTPDPVNGYWDVFLENEAVPVGGSAFEVSCSDEGVFVQFGRCCSGTQYSVSTNFAVVVCDAEVVGLRFGAKIDR
jgi:hypothetical protein